MNSPTDARIGERVAAYFSLPGSIAPGRYICRVFGVTAGGALIISLCPDMCFVVMPQQCRKLKKKAKK